VTQTHTFTLTTHTDTYSDPHSAKSLWPGLSFWNRTDTGGKYSADILDSLSHFHKQFYKQTTTRRPINSSMGVGSGREGGKHIK
jgi:hypothetical protein